MLLQVALWSYGRWNSSSREGWSGLAILPSGDDLQTDTPIIFSLPSEANGKQAEASKFDYTLTRNHDELQKAMLPGQVRQLLL